MAITLHQFDVPAADSGDYRKSTEASSGADMFNFFQNIMYHFNVSLCLKPHYHFRSKI